MTVRRSFDIDPRRFAQVAALVAVTVATAACASHVRMPLAPFYEPAELDSDRVEVRLDVPYRDDPSLDEQFATMIGQYEDMLSLYGTRTGVNLARKHIGWYTKGLSASAAFRFRLNQLPSIAEQRDAIDTYFESLATQGAPIARSGGDSEELAA